MKPLQLVKEFLMVSLTLGKRLENSDKTESENSKK